MLTVTPEAASAIRQLTDGPEMAEDAGLRIATTSNDDGQPTTFVMEVVSAPQPADEILEVGGGRLFLDPTATAEFDGKLLDATVDAGQVRFQVEEGNTA